MNKALRILAALAFALSALAALDLQGIIAILPAPWDAWVAFLPPAAGGLYQLVRVAGDILDDGERNDSWPRGPRMSAVLLPIGIGTLCLGLPSCTGIVSGLTGQPVPSVSVQRAGHDDAPVIQVAANDMAQAELGDPTTVHGLYDVGQVSAAVGQVVDSGK